MIPVILGIDKISGVSAPVYNPRNKLVEIPRAKARADALYRQGGEIDCSDGPEGVACPAGLPIRSGHVGGMVYDWIIRPGDVRAGENYQPIRRGDFKGVVYDSPMRSGDVRGVVHDSPIRRRDVGAWHRTHQSEKGLLGSWYKIRQSDLGMLEV